MKQKRLRAKTLQGALKEKFSIAITILHNI